jgi:hypothetical protein
LLESPLDQADDRGRVLGEDKQHIIGAKHAHRMLHRRPFIRNLENYGRHMISGGSLADSN